MEIKEENWSKSKKTVFFAKKFKKDLLFVKGSAKIHYCQAGDRLREIFQNGRSNVKK